jgi:hypothetical protein
MFLWYSFCEVRNAGKIGKAVGMGNMQAATVWLENIGSRE